MEEITEKAPKQLNIPLSTTGTKLMCGLLSRVLSIGRIGLSALFSLVLAVLVILVGKGNEATAPIAILFSMFALLFSGLLLYVLKRRPQIKRQILSEEGRSGRCIFGSRSVELAFDGFEPHILSYKEIKGQYWAGDDYMLLLDGKDYRSMIDFPVNGETFDDIYMLAYALSRRKIRLIQVKKGRKKE